MSRIFDALQRSGAEQSGVEYPDMMSVTAAVFEAEREPQAMEKNISVAVEELPLETQPVPTKSKPVAKPSGLEHFVESLSFPSLEVSNAPGSPLVFLNQPESLAAEKFRFLSVRLRQIRQNRPLKKVLVTSTIPEEGKSMVTANLASALARRKEKVLLIEGDLRRPVLADRFGLGTLAGLAEWLQSGAQDPSNIYHLTSPGFWIMPAGHPPRNTLELMQSGRLSALFRQISDSFDWVIVDSPPLLPLADTTVWARLTDGTLVVVREGTTQKGPLQRGLEMIKKADLLGVVLNGCTEIDHKYYYHRYSPPTSK